MKRKTILFISILQLLVITGCYDDLGNYGYTNSTKVSFVNSASSDYSGKKVKSISSSRIFQSLMLPMYQVSLLLRAIVI